MGVPPLVATVPGTATPTSNATASSGSSTPPWYTPSFPTNGVNPWAQVNAGGNNTGNIFGPFGDQFVASPYIYDPAAYTPSTQWQNMTNSQDDFANTLKGMAVNGTGPSVAAQQVQNAQMANVNQAKAMAATSAANGVNPALAYRNAENQMMSSNAQANQTYGLVRAQEQLNAMNAANQAYSTGFLNQSNLQNLPIQYQQNQAGAIQAAQGLNAQAAANNAANNQGMLGSIAQFASGLGSAIFKGSGTSSGPTNPSPTTGGGGGSGNGTDGSVADGSSGGTSSDGIDNSGLGGGGDAFALQVSDRRQKKKIKKDSSDSDGDLYEFLDKLKAYQYEYKNSKNGKGKQFSPMAQDLEKTPVGDAMVKETPRGKMVDYGKGFGAILAAQAQIHERLKKLESKGRR